MIYVIIICVFFDIKKKISIDSKNVCKNRKGGGISLANMIEL